PTEMRSSSTYLPNGMGWRTVLYVPLARADRSADKREQVYRTAAIPAGSSEIVGAHPRPAGLDWSIHLPGGDSRRAKIARSRYSGGYSPWERSLTGRRRWRGSAPKRCSPATG